MSEAEAIALVEEILEVDSGTVQADSDLEDLGWDSLSNLNLISIADDRYKVSVDPERLAKCETPADLHELLERGRR